MNNYQDKNVMKTKLILTAALLIAVFSGCKKEKDLAVPFGVRNTTETVYTTVARLEATFSYPGTKYVIRVDVSERQDMSEAVHYDVKVNGDRLTAEVTGLKGITTYYYRYINDTGFGMAGSGVKSFTTNDYSVPAVTTAEVSEITANSATCGGNVICDGGFAVTARGVCWSTSPNPTVSDSHTTDGSGTGSFTSNITGLTANTTYYVRAYATNSAGTSYGEQKSFTTQSGGGGGHEYVDLGLPSGLLWATCNVGADKPEDYGYHFAWGETTTKSTYGWSTYKWCNGSEYTLTKYCTYSNYGTVDNKTVLDPEDDVAHANWGGGWRMPTTGEWQELYDNTTCTWTTENGVAGRKFTSKTDSSKYIFLPAAGSRQGTSLYDAGSLGIYWSSSLYSSGPYCAYPCRMYFHSGCVDPQLIYSRYNGLTVRPVR